MKTNEFQRALITSFGQNPTSWTSILKNLRSNIISFAGADFRVGASFLEVLEKQFGANERQEMTLENSALVRGFWIRGVKYTRGWLSDKKH